MEFRTEKEEWSPNKGFTMRAMFTKDKQMDKEG